MNMGCGFVACKCSMAWQACVERGITKARPGRSAPYRTLAMNAPTEMSHEEVLRVKLAVLRREHRDLDHAIDALQEAVNPDQLTLRRLKKQKLALKDQIQRIEDELTPDIIA